MLLESRKIKGTYQYMPIVKWRKKKGELQRTTFQISVRAGTQPIDPQVYSQHQAQFLTHNKCYTNIAE